MHAHCTPSCTALHLPPAPPVLPQPPEAFFSHPQYQATGNLFWPDAWRNLVSDGAYSMHGVIPDVGRALIQAGKGYNPRDTESGQLLIDRARHLDVLEYLLWINRWGGSYNANLPRSE